LFSKYHNGNLSDDEKTATRDRILELGDEKYGSATKPGDNTNSSAEKPEVKKDKTVNVRGFEKTENANEYSTDVSDEYLAEVDVAIKKIYGRIPDISDDEVDLYKLYRTYVQYDLDADEEKDIKEKVLKLYWKVAKENPNAFPSDSQINEKISGSGSSRSSNIVEKKGESESTNNNVEVNDTEKDKYQTLKDSMSKARENENKNKIEAVSKEDRFKQLGERFYTSVHDVEETVSDYTEKEIFYLFWSYHHGNLSDDEKTATRDRILELGDEKYGSATKPGDNTNSKVEKPEDNTKPNGVKRSAKPENVEVNDTEKDKYQTLKDSMSKAREHENKNKPVTSEKQAEFNTLVRKYSVAGTEAKLDIKNRILNDEELFKIAGDGVGTSNLPFIVKQLVNESIRKKFKDDASMAVTTTITEELNLMNNSENYRKQKFDGMVENDKDLQKAIATVKGEYPKDPGVERDAYDNAMLRINNAKATINANEPKVVAPLSYAERFKLDLDMVGVKQDELKMECANFSGESCDIEHGFPRSAFKMNNTFPETAEALLTELRKDSSSNANVKAVITAIENGTFTYESALNLYDLAMRNKNTIISNALKPFIHDTHRDRLENLYFLGASANGDKGAKISETYTSKLDGMEANDTSLQNINALTKNLNYYINRVTTFKHAYNKLSSLNPSTKKQLYTEWLKAVVIVEDYRTKFKDSDVYKEAQKMYPQTFSLLSIKLAQ
jgi:hypothetical protein